MWNRLVLPPLLAMLTALAQAEVVKFEVLHTVPAYEGRSYGSVGAYVKITAKATIAVDPADPRNAVIADIGLAPRNRDGKVEAIADVVLIRPADLQRGNATLMVDVPNRGRKLAPQLFDDAGQPGANSERQGSRPGVKSCPLPSDRSAQWLRRYSNEASRVEKGKS